MVHCLEKEFTDRAVDFIFQTRFGIDGVVGNTETRVPYDQDTKRKEIDMSHAAKSILVFGVYILVMGIALLVAPNVVLGLLGFPLTTEVWIRVLGVVGGVLGFYYIQAGRNELTAFFRATVYGRCTFFVLLIGLVALGLAPGMLILFGVVDFLGAVWTGLALRGPKGTG